MPESTAPVDSAEPEWITVMDAEGPRQVHIDELKAEGAAAQRALSRSVPMHRCYSPRSIASSSSADHDCP